MGTMVLRPLVSSLQLILIIIAFPIICLSVPFHDTFCINFMDVPKTPPTTSSQFFKDRNIFSKPSSPSLNQKCLPVAIPSMSVYGVKDENGHVLNNVLHLEYKLPLPVPSSNFRFREDIVAIIIQADSLNSTHAGFGQFVENIKIPNTNSRIKRWDTKPTQFLPCSFVPHVEPLHPTVFVYTKDGLKQKLAEDLPIPPTPKPEENVRVRAQVVLSLIWKFPQSMCNFPKTVTFRGVLVKQLVPGESFVKKSLLEPLMNNLPAKAFIIPPITVVLSNKFPSQAPSLTPSYSVAKWRDLHVDLQSLDVDWVDSVEKPDLKSPSSIPVTLNFPEHCKPSSTTSSNCGKELPKCENPQKWNEYDEIHHSFYPEYSDYIERRLKFYCQCQRPDKISDRDIASVWYVRGLSDQAAPLEPKIPKEREPAKGDKIDELGPEEGILIDRFPGLDIWNFRIIHGLSHVISGMFVTPLSIFITRHYKETFMKDTIIFNKVWFITHLLSVFINFILHSCGMMAIYLSKQLGGVSTVENVTRDHGYPGYINTLLFIVLMLFGGIRCYQGCLRRICIALHWLEGLVYYISTLGIIVTSITIPGSPSNAKKWDPTQKTSYWTTHKVLGTIVIIWILLDLIFHISMDILRCNSDRSLGIKRMCFILPLPSLNEINRTDLPDTILRKIMLLIYFCVVAGFTLSACTIILRHPASLETLGPMSCSHTIKNKYNFSISSISKCGLHRPFDVTLFKNLMMGYKIYHGGFLNWI